MCIVHVCQLLPHQLSVVPDTFVRYQDSRSLLEEDAILVSSVQACLMSASPPKQTETPQGLGQVWSGTLLGDLSVNALVNVLT